MLILLLLNLFFLICYFFFSFLFARKKRKRSNPEKEKSRARLEFVGILKQELKTILSLFLLQNSTILCQSYRAFQAHYRSSNDTKKGTFINFLKFVPQTVTLGAELCRIFVEFVTLVRNSRKSVTRYSALMFFLFFITVRG